MEIKNKKETPLVSVITPCYNGENYVERFLKSLLNQTYNNMEVIFINDGSTDNTEKIVLFYKQKFLNQKIDFKYIYQDNAGQAAAINQGLKIFKGDYLIWPDSDDILHPNNIKNKVEFLEKNQEYGFVLCKARILDEESLEVIGKLTRKAANKKEDFFRDLIEERNVYFVPGAYMARSSSLLDVIPGRKIYESRGGQNWQLLLPLAYKYKYGYLDEFLFDYLVRSDSHSRETKTLHQKIERCNEHEDLLLNVINSINEISEKEKKYWEEIIIKKYLKKKYVLSFRQLDRDLLLKSYVEYKNKYKLSIKEKLYYHFSKRNSTYCIAMFVVKVRQKIKSIFGA